MVSESDPPKTAGEVLREDVGRTAVDQAVASDEAIAIDHLLGHAEIVAPVADQLVGFDERGFIQQQIDAFAGGELTFGVLAFPALVAASGFSAGMTAVQLVQAVRHKRLG